MGCGRISIRRWSKDRSPTERRGKQVFWTAAAWIINAGLAAGLLLGAVLLSHAIIVASDFAVWVIATIIPTANLLALSWRWSKNPRKQNFLTIVLWANRVGVALAVLFGVASAVELTYSGLEKNGDSFWSRRLSRRLQSREGQPRSVLSLPDR